MPLFLGNGADAGPAIGQKSSKRRRLEVSAASLQAGSTIVPKEGGAAGGAIPSNRPAATEHGAGGTSAQTTVEIGNRVEVVYDAELYTATVLAVDQASGNCSVRCVKEKERDDVHERCGWEGSIANSTTISPLV